MPDPTWFTSHVHVRRMLHGVMVAAAIAGAVLLFGNDRAWSVVVAFGEIVGLEIPATVCPELPTVEEVAS